MERTIQLPFSIDGSGGIAYTGSQAKVWQDRVVAVIMTNFNERVMRPNFGSNVGSSLFESRELSMSNLEDSVTSAFSAFLPELSIVQLKAYEDKNDPDGVITLDIRFSYPQLLSQAETSVIVKTQIISRSGDVLLEVGNG